MLITNCTLFDGETLTRDARVLVRDGKFAGPDAAAPEEETLDAGGRLVTPGLIDCHTHLVFGGTREDEFEERLAGVSYEQIMARGGGIRSTVAKTRAASEDDLVGAALPRLDHLRRQGVTTVEIKSGYGLSLDAELKMLRAVRRLRDQTPLHVEATFLGAHTIPAEFSHDRTAYVRLVIDEMMPAVAREGLASAVDVFCERGAFTLAEMLEIFEAAPKHGLNCKVHAEQLTHTGAATMAAGLGALSADHLEHLDAKGIEAMRRSGTVAVLLPGAMLFLDAPAPPVAGLRAAGVPMAVATDCNPGSSHTTNLHLMMSLACIRMRLTPLEALAGVTSVAAQALALHDRVGHVRAGWQADFVLWKCATPAAIPYSLGDNLVDRAYIRGERVV